MPDNNRVDLKALRDQTREQHEATEALLPLTEAGLDRDRYAHVLQAFYSFVYGWERWAEAHVPGRMTALFEERRRAGLLLRDLRHFGLDPLASPTQDDAALAGLLDGAPRDSARYEAAFLGSMYVMEGSTLGGQYIARQVEESLQLTPGEGDAYFRGHGERTGALWNAFREVLRAVPDEYAATVIAAAKSTFAYVQGKLQSSYRPPLAAEPAATARL